MAIKPHWTEDEVLLLERNRHLSVKDIQKIIPARNRRSVLNKLREKGWFLPGIHTKAVVEAGKVIGRFTVIRVEKQPQPSGRNATMALVRCNCIGTTELWLAATRLRCGGVSHCGCQPRIRPDRRKEDIPIGSRFGRWEVVGEPVYRRRKGTPQQYLLCRCSCDKKTEREMSATLLRRGDSTHCGCNNAHKRHGQTGTPLYQCWQGLCKRCRDKTHHRYGGRGITVCDEWARFEPFAEWALANGYREGLEIDRINNDGNYEPENCRFVDDITQNNNRHTTRHYEMDGKKQSIKQWWRDFRCVVSYECLRLRLGWGWPVLEAMTTKAYGRKRGTAKLPSTNYPPIQSSKDAPEMPWEEIL